MYDTTDRQTIDESYINAGNSSDLTVEADRRGDGDMLIAAGWSKSRLGAALLRLHSEWDAAEKPPEPTIQAIEALARTLIDIPVPHRLKKATEIAGRWRLVELQRLADKLKSLPEVREQLTLQAAKWRIEDAGHTVGAALKHWLHPTCSACHGRRWQLIPGTPKLSDRPCTVCHGIGEAKIPGWDDGRRVTGYIDDCINIARQLISKRLRNIQKRA